VGTRRVRRLFEDAKKAAPCIIFIDEIDVVGASRDTPFFRSNDGTLQQLLTELDGFEPNTGVVMIAATNMPEHLDAALIRPGRFDKRVVVPLPDVKGRKEILDLYLSKIKIGKNVDSHRIAKATPGWTGADISQLVNLAAIKAVAQGHQVVNLDVLEDTIDDIRMGRSMKTALVDDKTRENTAYHEAGHAIVSLFTEGSHPIHKATIIQRGRALGMVYHLPEGDQKSESKKQLMAHLAIALGGRAAEEVIFGKENVTTGASSDFKNATAVAYHMLAECGMSDKLGFVYHQPPSNKPFAQSKTSEHTMKEIDTEVKNLLDERFAYAKNVLLTHKDALHTLAKELLDRETLTGEEIQALLGKSKAKPSSSEGVHVSFVN